MTNLLMFVAWLEARRANMLNSKVAYIPVSLRQRVKVGMAALISGFAKTVPYCLSRLFTPASQRKTGRVW